MMDSKMKTGSLELKTSRIWIRPPRAFRPAALAMRYKPTHGTRISERLAARACTKWSAR